MEDSGLTSSNDRKYLKENMSFEFPEGKNFQKRAKLQVY